MDARQTVLEFWKAMSSNDFDRASQWLSEDFECLWPQSSELIRGRQNFAELNARYPAEGRWTFALNDMLVDADRVVTDVTVSDGTTKARAITFHTVENGRIRRQVEFWPEEYEAPAWRREWVERLDENDRPDPA